MNKRVSDKLFPLSISLEKQSRYMPEQAQKFPRSRGLQLPRQSAHEGGKVASPAPRPPLRPTKYPWHLFLSQAECCRKD